MKVDGGQLLETFRRYLRDRSLPVTHQRLAVAEAIFFSGDHLSAEDIAEQVAKGGAGPVGTATVYRTLELLVGSGLVTEHDFGEGFKRYEPGSSGGEGGGKHCLPRRQSAIQMFLGKRKDGFRKCGFHGGSIVLLICRLADDKRVQRFRLGAKVFSIHLIATCF